MTERFCPVCNTSMKCMGDIENVTIYLCKNPACGQEVNVVHFPHHTSVTYSDPLPEPDSRYAYDFEIRVDFLTQKLADKLLQEFLEVANKYKQEYGQDSVGTATPYIPVGFFWDKVKLAFSEFFYIIKYGK